MFFSCSNPTSKKNTVVNNVPDTAGYYAARNLKGISAFKIGETTYKQALNIIKDEIRKDSKKYKETNYKVMPKYQGYEAKYPDFTYDKNGNIATTFEREDFGFIYKEVKYDTIASYLKDDLVGEEVFGSPKLKALKIFQYYIGDIELMNFELKFFQDTLYNISSNQEDKVESGFKEKYGEGRTVKNDVWKTPFGIKNEAPENDEIMKKSKVLKIDEQHIWENKLIKAVSQTYIEYEYKDGGDSFSDAHSDSYFSIDSKNIILQNKITECKNLANKSRERLEAQKKQKEINQL
jgi:NADH dehydrogenase/NADH:ubiquinone oxidoreductase subunit G